MIHSLQHAAASVSSAIAKTRCVRSESLRERVGNFVTFLRKEIGKNVSLSVADRKYWGNELCDPAMWLDVGIPSARQRAPIAHEAIAIANRLSQEARVDQFAGLQGLVDAMELSAESAGEITGKCFAEYAELVDLVASYGE